MEQQRQYIAIDLKSFYASAECVARGLDPLTTNLVVADVSRTEKTICLAVSPSLKAYGISGRARLFEVVERVRKVNMERLCYSPEGIFTGRSYDDNTLKLNPALELDYIAAPPRMKHYMNVSAKIYSIYLRFVAPEDIFAYSIDEVFMDVTNYLGSYHTTAHQLATKMIREVLRETGITATAGIGTNLFLAKVAMDIEAKHCKPDEQGVRIAELDEASYRRKLWDHRPITDFWRIGRGTARRLATLGIGTMGELARYSLEGEQQLYRTFGVNAELLIDHAWGWEPTTIKQVKAYKPTSNSLSNGQVLKEPYTCEKARVVVREMAHNMSGNLTGKGLATKLLGLYIGYDIDNLEDPIISKQYKGDITPDYYGRNVPSPANGNIKLKRATSSSHTISDSMVKLFDRIVNPQLMIRRIYVAAYDLVPSDTSGVKAIQLSIFDNPEAIKQQEAQNKKRTEREKRMQTAELIIKKRFGKNSILRGTDFEDGATARERNSQVGGHKG